MNFFFRYFLYKSGLRVKFILAGNYHFCYAERGRRNSKPTLILVHGFSSSKDMFTPIVQVRNDNFFSLIRFPKRSLRITQGKEGIFCTISCEKKLAILEPHYFNVCIFIMHKIKIYE